MKYVIVGNGAAGAEAAVQIRRNDNDGDILLVSQCPYAYYYKPRLIDYIAGTAGIEEFRIHKGDFYTGRGIVFKPETGIVSLDPDNQTVSAHSGAEYPYDRLLLATGARSFIPDIPGADKEGVFDVRGIRDCNAIIDYAKNCTHAAVIGGGLLGLETAASLQKRFGLSITVIEMADRLLPRQLDGEGAAVLRDILEERGFRFRLPDSVEAVEGGNRAEGVALSSGEAVKADIVIISSGIRARTELAERAGAEIKKGIVVDDRMRTSREHIWAAGDPAEHNGIIYGIWPAAREQGRIAGLDMAGADTAYEGTPSAKTLKVTGIDLYSAGDVFSDEGNVYVISDGNTYIKAVFENGALKGVIVLGHSEAAQSARNVFEDKADADELMHYFEEV